MRDHLISVIDGNETVTRYVYSDRDLLTEELSEVSGRSVYTYNEHSALVSETEARGITVRRTVDVLDRVTFVDYPDNKLDITYTFDDPAVPFSKGRLTSIGRNGSSVDYRYDRFGRTLQDGALSYLYDRNGNRVEIGYPGGVSATYTFDYADRETSLSVRRGTAAAQAIASNATYKPLGPLTGLTLGNGLQEIRNYDQRYFPSSIQVPGHLHWTYTTDKVGNILRIRDELVPASTRDYGYQDHQYYLTRGDGPWGDLSWAYDRLGNRLSETRDGVRTDYTYSPNAAGKSSAKRESTRPAVEGAETTTYGFDAAGNQIHQTTPSSKVVYTYNDADAGVLLRFPGQWEDEA